MTKAELENTGGSHEG